MNNNSKTQYYRPMKYEGEKVYDQPGNCPVCGMYPRKRKVFQIQRQFSDYASDGINDAPTLAQANIDFAMVTDSTTQNTENKLIINKPKQNCSRLGVMSAIGTYLYVFHKPHRNVAKEKPEYVLNAQKLYNDFISREDSSYIMYEDKVIQVSGTVADISTSENSATVSMITPLNGISFGFDSTGYAASKDKLKSIHIGDTVMIKGKLGGFDMIMG